MSDVFGGEYARAYDLIYQEKDYEAECDLLERIFEGRGVRSVVDLGCGTGGHGVVLAQRGYEVIGIDRSEAMLEGAHAKAQRAGVKVDFRRDDVRSARLDRTVDGVISMFAVVGYQLSNEDVLSTLRTARSMLQPGGVLVFDVWYGPAVITERPSERVKVLMDGGKQLIRASSGSLDIASHRCDVTIRVWECSNEGQTETVEQHAMRFFFPMELRLLLESAGFEFERLGAFPEFERDPDLSTWSAIAVATAR